MSQSGLTSLNIVDKLGKLMKEDGETVSRLDAIPVRSQNISRNNDNRVGIIPRLREIRASLEKDSISMVVRTRKGKLAWKRRMAARGRKPCKSLPKPRLNRSNK